AFATYFGNGLGIGGNQNFLFNDWTRTGATVAPQLILGLPIAGGNALGVAGSIFVDQYINDVEAVIGAAKIDQSTSELFRGSPSNPNDGQSVNVQAQTTYDHLAMDGNFDLSQLAVGGFLGVQGAKNGAGATVRANVMNSTTIAQIDSGAM